MHLAMSNQLEIQRDKQRIDDAIERLEEVMGTGDPQAIILGAKALVPLLERRSKLLGLDAPPSSGTQQSAPSEPMARILAAVPK